MGARLSVTDPEPCVERDLLLAKKIGDSDYPMEYYTILRGNRNYYLGIGLFYREPKRTSWEEVCRFISENGSGKNLIWHADQTNGLRVMYQYENETQAIEETFPKCRLSPIHIFVTCDSGAVADQLLLRGQIQRIRLLFLSAESIRSKIPGRPLTKKV